MGLIDIPCERVELASEYVGSVISVRLGPASATYDAVVVATIPHSRRLLISLPDGLVDAHPTHPLGRPG